MLDGAAPIPELVEKAVADGQPALGITDHGNMYGVLHHYKACKAAGIKPILGLEAYQAYEHRDERPKRTKSIQDDLGGDTENKQKLYYHLTVLAENNVGYKNLIQLASRAFLEGFYYKPRIDWETLQDHASGLIVTTGCLGGQVLQKLLQDDYGAALATAGRLQEIVGKQNLFVEIQDHGIPDQRKTMQGLVDISKALGAPLLATNDSHYVNKEDHEKHDCLLCVQTGSKLWQPDRFKFPGTEHYLKTAAEMRELFSDYPDACDNTLLIADRCNVEIKFGESHLPKFPTPQGFENDKEYLRHLVFAGAKKRWRNLTDEITERLLFELQVIEDMGFSSYFLITSDIINYARGRNITCGPGRGSAAGCAVAYALEITNLDPIKYDLLFERFLNPARVSMPDIDMDFDSRYRDELIRYTAEKYGREHVSQIVTFGTIKARAAVRDAARILGQPLILGDKIAKSMPPLLHGKDTPLEACFTKTPGYEAGYEAAKDLRDMVNKNPDAAEVVKVARGLEGMLKSDGIHAAAVVISDTPLTDYLPVQRKPQAGVPLENCPIVSQYDMHNVEELGLLKMDFLGLKNLDTMSETARMVKESRGIDINYDTLTFDDPETYEMLSRGESIGVFQLESAGMRELLGVMKPDCFDDLGALVALYRPGPMDSNMHIEFARRKQGKSPVEYLHPDAKEALESTYGLMIYQESMMRIAQKFAGYSLAEADLLRKACGKKIREVMMKERQKFIDGCEKTGYGVELGKQWWAIIEPFADYAFNKSHAYCYAAIAYYTAWLKIHFPVEYMAALMTTYKKSPDRVNTLLHECRRLGVKVLTPDINYSGVDFNVMPPSDKYPDGAILFGLSTVRGVGTKTIEALVEARDPESPFVSFMDFVERAPQSILSASVLAPLTRTGAFDEMGHSRRGLYEAFDSWVRQEKKRRKKREDGKLYYATLFRENDEGPPADLPSLDLPEFDEQSLLALELEFLGTYVSGHPLLAHTDLIHENSTISISALTGTVGLDEHEKTIEKNSIQGGDNVTLAGLVVNVDLKNTKKGDQMAILTLQDTESSVEIVVFPKTFAGVKRECVRGSIVKVMGVVQERLIGVNVIADDIMSLVDAVQTTKPEKIESAEVEEESYPTFDLNIPLPENFPYPKVLEALHDILLRHPGLHDTVAVYEDQRASLGFCVTPSEELRDAIERLCGRDVVLWCFEN